MQRTRLLVRNALKKAIRTHRRSRLSRRLADTAERYLRAWKNEDFYDFHQNGEQFVLSKFREWWSDRPIHVWDVGAHRGEWATLARSELPSARITSFEMIPEIYADLAKNLAGQSWSSTVCSGLSDRTGTQMACWNRKFDTTNSLSPRLGDPLFDEASLVEAECRLMRGDEYAARNDTPHILKIDTEGHEVSVLRGCAGFLAGDQPPEMIQFEYGSTFLPSRSTLKQVYEILEPCGYRIGRLYADHVEFRPYSYALDDFRMGNFIAVRSDTLAAELS